MCVCGWIGKPLDPAKPIVRRPRYVVGEFVADPSHRGEIPKYLITILIIIIIIIIITQPQ